MKQMALYFQIFQVYTIYYYCHMLWEKHSNSVNGNVLLSCEGKIR